MWGRAQLPDAAARTTVWDLVQVSPPRDFLAADHGLGSRVRTAVARREGEPRHGVCTAVQV
jgi:hypothetical protein